MANNNINNATNNLAPSMLQPLSSIFPAPIVALRAPTTNDKKYPIGQIWIYSTNNTSYILTSVVANVATWVSPATTGALTTGNLTVVGTLTQTGGAVSIGADAAANNIAIGTGAAAKAITIGNGTGATSVVISGGTGAMSFGSNAVAHTVSIGTLTGAAVTNIQAGTGNINLVAPFVTATTGTTFYISSGNGAPAGATCVNVGDLYIRSDGSSTTTRMYICTVIGTTWTSITTAA